jgi:hypothetical protein
VVPLLRAKGVFSDDWDVYYERARKPKESIIKYEAARSEGDYRLLRPGEREA